MTEKRDLLVAMKPKLWEDTETPLPEIIIPWSPATAEAQFIARFIQLGIRPLISRKPSEGAREESLTVADSLEKPQHKNGEKG
jgi:hypothetical protein